MLPRLLVCLSLAACAGSARPATKTPSTAPRYELCRDFELRCVPATRPVQVDMNVERREPSVT